MRTPRPRRVEPVVGGAARHRVVEVGRLQHAGLAERRESVGDQPRVERPAHPIAQHRRLHDAAVEEHVGRRGQSARAAPQPDALLGAVRGQVGEEPREVPGDRGIGGIGQAQLLQADPTRPLRPRIGADHREEALDQRVDQLVARELGGDRAADQARAPAQYGDGLGLDASPLEEPLLADPALVPELLELPRVDAVAGALELLLQPSRERQIHVVAAQQDVLAHGDAVAARASRPPRRPR